MTYSAHYPNDKGEFETQEFDTWEAACKTLYDKVSEDISKGLSFQVLETCFSLVTHFEEGTNIEQTFQAWKDEANDRGLIVNGKWIC